MKQIRFFFDWGACHCLWDDEGLMNYDGLVSESLCAMLTDMATEFQTALNWADPAGPSPWSQARRADFVRRAKIAYQQLCAELGDQYEVVYAFSWFEK